MDTTRISTTPSAESVSSRHPGASTRRWRALLAGMLIWLVATPALAETIVELEILNPTDENGDIVVIAGEAVEVEFTVVQNGEGILTRWDRLQLVNVADGRIISQKWRGRHDNGTISLKVPQKKIPRDSMIQIFVRYKSFFTGEIITTAANPDTPGYTPLIALPEASIAELTTRVIALENGDTDPLNEVQTLTLTGQHWLSQRWALTWEVGQAWTTLYDKQRFRAGFTRQF